MRLLPLQLVLVGCGEAAGGPTPPAGDASSEASADAGVDGAVSTPAERVIAWGHPQTCTSGGDCRPNDPVDGVAGAGAACISGMCAWGCGPIRANCDGNAANGCEADVSSDSACGACGAACAGGTHCTRVCDGPCVYRCR